MHHRLNSRMRVELLLDAIDVLAHGGQPLAAVVAAGDGALAQRRLVETGGPAILTHPQPAEVLAAGRILAHD
jgi:hypothetical protein